MQKGWTLCAHWKDDKCGCGIIGYIWSPNEEDVVAQMGYQPDEGGQCYPNVGQDGMRADARLIVALRNALPALLDALKAADVLHEECAHGEPLMSTRYAYEVARAKLDGSTP